MLSWLAKKPDAAYLKFAGHPAKRDTMSSSWVEAINSADSGQNNGTGARDLQPGEMMLDLLKHGARRAEQRAKLADDAPHTTERCLTPGMQTHLADRMAASKKALSPYQVRFLNNNTRISAVIKHGSPAVERAVKIGAHPSCECGAYVIEKIPCGCMLIVCESAGKNPVTLVQTRDTVEHWKTIYANLPENKVPGTEFLPADDAESRAAPAAPKPPGRPSKKRMKGAMDMVKKLSKASDAVDV